MATAVQQAVVEVKLRAELVTLAIPANGAQRLVRPIWLVQPHRIFVIITTGKEAAGLRANCEDGWKEDEGLHVRDRNGLILRIICPGF
jgi:hypothetical protein